jgi:ATP-dependent exoDNAse (exonuclease V) alpha subunit
MEDRKRMNTGYSYISQTTVGPVDDLARTGIDGLDKILGGGIPRGRYILLVGGPGTGKTTIITAILKIFQQLKLKILLAAPTGRAAKRMSEATGWESKTIHRLLEYSPQKGGFKKDQDDPLEADVVIIDEASMVDTLLMYHLLKAIPPQAHLILVGDVDQLPSVGPGNVLKDIIGSDMFTVVRLTEIFRQAQERYCREGLQFHNHKAESSGNTHRH